MAAARYTGLTDRGVGQTESQLGVEAMPQVRLEDIYANYGKKEILRGVSVDLAKGETLALFGPNGAGKSTLLKVAAGFLSPVAGQVWFSSRRVTSLPPHQRVRLGSGYFMQGGRVFASLTVKENLEVGTTAGNKQENTAVILDLFPRLKELLGRRAGLLSGGERQSLALAMVLIKRPRILLLDEPSAGLSPKLIQDMLLKVKEVSQSWGVSVLMVEQNIREAINIASRVLVLVKGQVALQSEHPKDLLTGAHLERIFIGGDSKREAV